MKLTRTSALAALLVVALAAPAAAFALDRGSDDHPKDHSSHVAKAKHEKSDRPGHATGRERAEEASADGRAHAEAMKAWAKCVAEKASGPKSGQASGPPKDACGDKPMPPGRAKHETGKPAQRTPPGLSPDRPRGKSGTHRSR